MSNEQVTDCNNTTQTFDWESYSSDCPSTRKGNTRIETPVGVKLFCTEPYAEEALKQYLGDFTSNNRIEEVHVNQLYEGTVSSINMEWCTINVGYRDSVYVDMAKESKEFTDMLRVGETVNVQIIESKGSIQGEYTLGSVEAGVKRAMFDEILKSIEHSKTAYSATVKSLIPGGGYIIDIQGVECFMPGSLAGINKLHDFESILDTTMYVVPMNYSSDRGTIVVSHREYLKALIPTRIEEIKEYESNVLVTGTVTGSAKYGVFCEFNECLTGMIYASDLSEENVKRHAARDIKPGESIEFFIKKVISDTKITLSQREVEHVSDPWKNVSERFNTPVEITGSIRSVKDYGVFIDIGEGLVGLLHVSEFPEGYDLNELEKGAEITVTVTRIDEETRKVFMEL